MTHEMGQGQLPGRHELKVPRVVKIAAGVTLGAATVAGGVFIADKQGVFDSGSSHVQTANLPLQPDTIPGTAIPNPLKTKTSTAIPTEASTAIPTPEKLKTVAWNADQIAKAQQEALLNNKILFLDTWSADGGKVLDAKNYKNLPTLVVNYVTKPEGKIFDSPISGTVSGVGITILSDGTKLKALFITDGKIEVELTVDFDSNILVKNDQKVTAGTPLITLSGNLVPSVAGFSKPGYVVMGDVTNFTSTTADILTDPNGAIVTVKK